MEYWANMPMTAFAAGSAEWASDREREGWHGVCASDHLFIGAGGVYPHPWVKLGEMAAATSTVRLTTSFANNLFRSPVEFAQAALTVQSVSNGRFEAGLGAGWAEEEMVRTGRSFPSGRERVAMLAEALEIVASIFSTGGCERRAEHYSVDIPEGTFTPLLGGESPPPLVASAGGKILVRRVAPLVDRLEVTSSAPATRGGQLDFDLYRAITDEFLREAVAVARDASAAVAIGTYVMVGVAGTDVVEPLRGMVGDGFMGRFIGEPASVAEALEELADLGFDRVQLTEMIPGSIERLAPSLPLQNQPVAVGTGEENA